MKNELVSIIIPTQNRKKDLKECLNSLLSQKYPYLEIIVVDNGSFDGTIEMLSNNFQQVTLIRNKQNKGAAFAKNQGINVSKGKYIWFLDSDSKVLNRSCLSNMIKILNQHPEIGSIGGEMYKKNNKFLIRKKKYLLNGETSTTVIKEAKPTLVECDYLPTSNCFMKKKLFLKLGGFDPLYFFLVEDKDLGYRIKKSGYKNILDYRTLVLHKISKERKSDLFLNHRNKIRFVIKNLSIINIIFLPVLDLFYLFDFKKIHSFKRQEISIIKHIPKKLQNSKWMGKKFILKLITVGIIYIFTLILGYIYNLIFLPYTLFIRVQKTNFLLNDYSG